MARNQVKSVSGMVVAITGGARGIGKATAQSLIRRGARVSIGDLDAELAEQTANELGGNCVAFELDVTDRTSFADYLDSTENELGGLDVVINNAGIMPLGPLVEESDETAKLMVDINLHGVIFGTKLAMERLTPKGSGHIVNIASQAGKGGFPGAATYCATKHAVVGLCEAVKAELEETDVEVSCVMPAVVNTELGSGLQAARGVKSLEPEDVAEAIVEAIETNRYDVWVPKESQYISTVMNVVPRKGREAIGKAIGVDKILSKPDKNVRAAYEDRAATSSRGGDSAGEADAGNPGPAKESSAAS